MKTKECPISSPSLLTLNYIILSPILTKLDRNASTPDSERCKLYNNYSMKKLIKSGRNGLHQQSNHVKTHASRNKPRPNVCRGQRPQVRLRVVRSPRVFVLFEFSLNEYLLFSLTRIDSFVDSDARPSVLVDLIYQVTHTQCD